LLGDIQQHLHRRPFTADLCGFEACRVERRSSRVNVETAATSPARRGVVEHELERSWFASR
jgi:hypothetical protein